MRKNVILTLTLLLLSLLLKAQTPCPNAVVNGDFEAGNTGFTSSLASSCECVSNSFCVNTNFNRKCAGWPNLENHTSGGANFLLIDGSTAAATNVWASTVPVSPGDTYTFSFWVASVYPTSQQVFDLGMVVNGVTVKQFTISQVRPNWTEYTFSGVCPPNLRSMPIAIRQMSAGGFRDFGLDDIYFACCPCKADYTTTSLDNCRNIQFNNISTGSGVTYAWSFGDSASGVNNTSSQANPTHLFSKCGSYEVCLTLSGGNCSSKICYNVVVTDNIPPQIACPRNLTVNTNAGQCFYTGTLPQPSVSDNCAQAPEIICSLLTPTSSILITPQTQFPKGVNTISCIARDECGNTSRACTYTLTVKDNQAPVITCPISMSVLGVKDAQGRCKALISGQGPTVTDNCPMTTLTYAVTGATTATGSNNLTEVNFMEGLSTVTYTAVDMDGNKATCSFTITVRCPCEAGFTFANLNDCGNVQFTNTSTGTAPLTYVWNFGDPNSGTANTSTLQNPSHQFSKCGTYEVCLTITGNGCSSKVCKTVVIKDDQAPKIVCPPTVTVSTNPGQCYFSGKFTQPKVTDNCDQAPELICSWLAPTSSILISPETQFPKGEHIISCIVVDACGNGSEPCNYTLIVVDKEPPVITCPANVTVQGTLNADGLCKAVVRGIAPKASDNCPMLGVNWKLSGATIGQGIADASGTNFMQGVTTVTYTALDMAGNSVTCSFTVTVNCPCQAGFNITYLNDCGNVQFTNTSTGTAPLTYVWNFGDPGSGTANTSTLQNPSHQFSKCDTFEVCLTITGNGCSSKVCKTVVFKDNQIPKIVCPPNVTVSTNPGQCYFSGKLVDPKATDNCDKDLEIICRIFAPNRPITITPQTQFAKGEHLITCFAVDDCGNVSETCSYILTVVDKELPIITCPANVTVQGTLNPQGLCKAVVKNIAPKASDNCPMLGVNWKLSGATIGQGVADASGTNFMQGVTTVTYMAVDMAGNTATCSFTVTVQCAAAICCPEFRLIQLDSIISCDNKACRDTHVGRIPTDPRVRKMIACKNSVHNYYIVPNLPGFIYTWNVIGGTPASTTGNPGVITWGSSDEGFIEVIITDASGNCRDTITQEICLIDAPIAGFTVKPSTTICVGQQITFTNTSVGGITYHWDFGDGTSSTSPNPPPHTYNAVRTYTVVLTVSNDPNSNTDNERSCGCKDTATVVINVVAGTGPSITSSCKKMLCPLDTASYCVNQPGCAGPYTWTVNGGTIIANNGACITVQWNATAPATLPASVSVTGCSGTCGSSATLDVPVLWNNLPISGPNPVCVGATETYSLPTMPGTFYTWTVIGGGGIIVGPNQNTPSINVLWNGPTGTATITCNYNNPYSGCSGTSSMTVKVNPEFVIVGLSPICAGNTSVYQVTTGLSAADWTISPGVPAVDFTVGPTNNVSTISVKWITPGNYTITATPILANQPLFCNKSSTVQVVVNPTPVISIQAPPTVCPNQLNTFSATSSLSGGSFFWSLTGGGTVSPYGPSNSNASVTLSGSGSSTLTVMQTVNGCTGSASLPIPIVAPPVLPTGTITTCIGGKITISLTSSSGPGPYTWSTSPAASLISGQGTNTATYEIHGAGTISVSNCGGSSNIVSVTTTNPTPVSITSTGSLCAGNLQLTTSAPGTYQWFGGSSGTTQTIHINSPGIYTLQVTSPNGCISVATHTVPPEVVPSVSISTGDRLVWCSPAVPNVTMQAFTQSQGTGCSYQWYQNSTANPVGANSPTYTATAFGSYFVVVTCGACVATSNVINVIQDCGQTPCTTYPVPPNPFPLSAITVTDLCNTKKFSVNVTGCSGGTVTWYFGDGTTTTGSSVSHTYTQYGVFPVIAEIECNGCKFKVNTSVSVPVMADFNYSLKCGANGSYTISFNNTSQTLGGWNVTNVNWTSNCGTLSSATGNSTVLTTPPNCSPNVTMTITVQLGSLICTDSKVITLNLPTQPLSITGSSVLCKDQISVFNPNWTGATIVQHAWTVNGTPVSQNSILSYTFSATGNYTIGLSITDIYGCTFTAMYPVTVVMSRPLSLAPAKICPDCLPATVLSVTPSSGFTNYQWYQNGVAVGSGSTYQLCQFDASGNYYVTATDSQVNNCPTSSNTVAVTYYPKPQADIQGQTLQCVPANGPYNIVLSNAGGNNSSYTYNWVVSGPGSVTFSPNNLQANANVTVTALGTYQFILTVSDAVTGCMAKDTFCVYLCVKPTLTVGGPAGQLCAGTPHTFTATAAPAGNYVYVWSNGATGSTITTSQAGYYWVTVTDTDCGCSVTKHVRRIVPQPSAILFPTGCDTICDKESITPPLALGGIGWPNNLSNYQIQWFLSGNPTPFFTGPILNFSGGLPSPLVYDLNKIYIVVTYNGCSDTSNVYEVFIKKCCECRSELTLTHGKDTYAVFCNPRVGFVPALSCPEADVVVSGFFGFEDPATGKPCKETTVIWELLHPNGSTQGGVTTNFTNFIFPKDSVHKPGLYCLTLTTISPDGKDTCICKVSWVREPCDCCTTLEDFCERLENNVTLSVDNARCKATVNIGKLPPCDAISWINWGDDSPRQFGPFPPGSMPMHTYSRSGTYIISYLAVEVNPVTGKICFEKTFRDTIVLNCDSICKCGGFSDLSFRPARGAPNIAVKCGDTIGVSCNPAFDPVISGVFQCVGKDCPAVAVHWDLFSITSGLPVASGNVSGPNFSIALLAAYFSTPGTYALTLSGQCGGKSCPPCKLIIKATGCPCCADFDVFCQSMMNHVEIKVDSVKCKATLTVCNIRACDYIQSISWGDGSNSAGPFGPGAMSMHTYTGSGTYIISYLAIEKDPITGKICFEKRFSDTITIVCKGCACKGADNLYFGGLQGAKTIAATCGSTTPVELPCSAAGAFFFFHGDVFCDGDSCLGDQIGWSIGQGDLKILSGSMPISNIILGGNQGHFDLNNLDPAMFAPGVVYTLNINWTCGGKACSCRVRFVFKGCPDCACGKFTEVFLRPNSGPSIALSCGDKGPLVPCPVVGQPFNITGAFACQGDNCPKTTPVKWTLLDPSGVPVATGSVTAMPNFSINLSPALFSKKGEYCLKLEGYCGAKLCECLIKFRLEAPCPSADCVCGTYSGMFIRSGQRPSIPVVCGCNPVPVGCPPNGQNLVLTGQFQCQGQKCPDTTLMDWVLIGPNGPLPIASGTSVTANPNFSIGIPPSLLTQAGVYTLKLIGHCGKLECPCVISFIMDPPCPKESCTCGDYELFVKIGTANLQVRCNDTIDVPSNFGFYGSFECKGNACPDSAVVTWTLDGPRGFSQLSGLVIATPDIFISPLDPANLTIPGLYSLSLESHCGADSCPCTIYFRVSDYCCKDSAVFLQNAKSVKTNGELGDCIVRYIATGLTDCMRIRYDWGDGKSSGIITSNNVPITHIYAAPGKYVVCYTIEELKNGLVCQRYTHCDTVEVLCRCGCGTFEQVKLVNKKLGTTRALNCDTKVLIVLPCPPVGKPYIITGKLVCNPTDCKGSNLHWELRDSMNTVVASGNQAGPWFSVTLDYSILAKLKGNYRLVLTGMCGSKTCSCNYYFQFTSCPPTCPCDDAFTQSVQAGFNWGWAGNGNCAFAFTPKGILDCDKVSWTISGTNNLTNTPLVYTGTTLNNQTFTQVFPNGILGNFLITMTVSHIGPDGKPCERKFTQTVKINCIILGIAPVCTDNMIINPGFNQNSMPGILGRTGKTNAWVRQAGMPNLVDDAGFADRYSILLSGKCFGVIDVISNPVVLGPKRIGRVSFAYKALAEDLRPGTHLVLRLSDNPLTDLACKDGCVEIARMPINATDGKWGNMSTTFSLNGLEGKKLLSLHVENDLAYEDPDANSKVSIDNLCFEQLESLITDTRDLLNRLSIRIFPNPNPGKFTVELPQPATPGMSLRVTDLAGRLVLEKSTEVGNPQQSIQAEYLSAGMYFLQIVEKGRIVGVEKFVKQ